MIAFIERLYVISREKILIYSRRLKNFDLKANSGIAML